MDIEIGYDPRIVERLQLWAKDPELFVKECIGATPSKQQSELLRNLSSQNGVPDKKRHTVRSGHGTGKDACVSWIILWFLCTRPYPKVVCTAPTGRQLYDILWSETHKWLRQSKVVDEFIWQKDKIFIKGGKQEWWARAVSAQTKASKEEQAVTLQGFHGDHLLIIVDEASGVPDPVYLPLEGAMTQDDNIAILIANPNTSNGYFADTHKHEVISKSWTKYHWDSEESELVSKEWIRTMEAKYGRTSNVFQIRVKGNFPSEDETVFIPYSWAIQCVGNDIPENESEPLYLGVDVARYGDDSTVILPRRGLVIKPWEVYRGLSTVDVAGNVARVAQELDVSGVSIDEIGVGAGVVDFLEKHWRYSDIPLFGVNVAHSSSDPTRFHRLRDELWSLVRDKCMKGLYSFPEGEMGEDLASELSTVRYEYDANGALVIESKKRLKARGLASPNIADALNLSEYFASISTKVFPSKTGKNHTYNYDNDSSSIANKHAWMCS